MQGGVPIDTSAVPIKEVAFPVVAGTSPDGVGDLGEEADVGTHSARLAPGCRPLAAGWRE